MVVKALFFFLINIIRKISIYKRLLISYMIVIIVPSVVMVNYIVREASSAFEINSTKYTQQFINTINDTLSERLSNYENLTYKLYSDEDLNSDLRESSLYSHLTNQKPEAREKYAQFKKMINLQLMNYASTLAYISSVEIVTDFEEYTQVSPTGVNKGAKLQNIAEFRRSPTYERVMREMGGTIWMDEVGSVFVYQATDLLMTNHVTLLRAIPNMQGGKPLGVIVLNISKDIFLQLYSQDDMIHDGNLLLVSEMGNPIFSLNENVNGPYMTKEIRDEIANNHSSSFKANTEGQESLVVYEKSSFTGWTLVDLIPTRSLLSSVYAIRNVIFKTSLLFIVIAVIFSVFVATSIYNPLKKLRKTMDKVNRENLYLRYEDKVKDEIGLLGHIFNNMIERIRTLIAEIYEAHEETKKEELLRMDAEIQKKEAELNELQMQMNPHFLYNTLDLIRWQALFQENGEGKVSQMIADFSALLRASLIRSRGSISLEEELTHARLYLNVLDFRSEHNIEVSWNIEAETLQSQIIKMVLQPLIENAVIHGFQNVDREKILKITVTKQLNCLHIKVADNGRGIPEDKVRQLNEELSKRIHSGKSIGIRNVNERIKLRYGDPFGVQIESEIATGTVVTLIMPYFIN